MELRSGGGHRVEHFRTGDQSEAYIGDRNVFNATTIHYTSNSGPPHLDKTPLLEQFGPVDPQHEKSRILAGKDELDMALCAWVFADPLFERWWRAKGSNTDMLWVHGDPGKGKTMISAATVDEITSRLAESPGSGVLGYFFCQRTDQRLSSAVAVLKGIIHTLIKGNQGDEVAQILFSRGHHPQRDQSISFWALWDILVDVIENAVTKAIFILVDALDECSTGLPDLLTQLSRRRLGTKVRWFLTSRNEVKIREHLGYSAQAGSDMSLELNSDSVTAAVKLFIEKKVYDLARRKKYSGSLEDEVTRYLQEHADGTFLWVSLVCQQLGSVRVYDTQKRLQEVPAGLEALYTQMLDLIELAEEYNSVRLDARKSILRTVATACCPLNLRQLTILSSLPEEFHDDEVSQEEAVLQCGFFLSVNNGVVSFIHQSSKDFFARGRGRAIFQVYHNELFGEHERLLLLSLTIMNKLLRRNICQSRRLGSNFSDFDQMHPECRLPTELSYACRHWIDHFDNASHEVRAPAFFDDGIYLQRSARNKQVQEFLESHFLHWLEVMAILRELRRANEGLGYVSKLPTIVHTSRDSVGKCLEEGFSKLHRLLMDARHFLSTFISIIEQAPLQLYASAIALTPDTSLIKATNVLTAWEWMTKASAVHQIEYQRADVLEGHSKEVSGLAFSQTGQLLASSSKDGNICVWRASTGQLLRVFEWKAGVRELTLVGDRLLAASAGQEIGVWDVQDSARDSPKVVLNNISATIISLRTTLDEKSLIAVSSDGSIRSWDSKTQEPQAIGVLGGRLMRVRDAQLSADGSIIVASTFEGKVAVWPLADVSREPLKFHIGDEGKALPFDVSQTGKMVAVGLWNGPLLVWYLDSDKSRTFPGAGQEEAQPACIKRLSFSSDANFLACGHDDNTITVLDPNGGQVVRRLDFSAECLHSLFFFHSCNWLFCQVGRVGEPMVRLWRPDGAVSHLCKRSELMTTALAWGDAYLVTGSEHGSITVWDAERLLDEHECVENDELPVNAGHHGQGVNVLRFSPDGKIVASGSADSTVKIWDPLDGTLRQTLPTGNVDHAHEVLVIEFSCDSALLGAGMEGGRIKVWRLRDLHVVNTFSKGSESVTALAFTPSNKFLASGYDSGLIIIWEVENGTPASINRVHQDWITRLLCSPTGDLLASRAASDPVVRILNIAENSQRGTMEMLLGENGATLFTVDGELTEADVNFVEDGFGSLRQGTWLRSDLTLSNGSWILWRRREVFWLPNFVRKFVSAAYEGTVVLGLNDGRVICLNFDLERLAQFFDD